MKRTAWALPFMASLWAALCMAQSVSTPTSLDSGRAESAGIPITTASEKARGLYLDAQALADKLHAPDAYRVYGEAVAADSTFAMGWYGLATSSPTAGDFFRNLGKAVALADRASPGERDMILAVQAGANSDPAGQLKHLQALIEACPDEARAHFLLGGYYFGQQEFDPAIEHYQKAVELNPDFSPAYNLLGYAYRTLDRNDQAEQAFQRYIALLPDEPNPYDSYAELLMRMGRFDESIENYRKALSKDPKFVFSLTGIGNDQMFLGQTEEARKTFDQLYEVAPNDGVKRTALFWTAASWLHEGKREKALETMKRMSAIAEKNGDRVAVSGDLGVMGNVLIETGGLPDEALDLYRRSVEVMESADASDEVKEAARRNMLYDEALVALRKGDLKTAAAKTEAYRSEAEPKGVAIEVQQVHELAGRIALANKDWDEAIAELGQANQQDPRILWDLARAYEGKGDLEKAGEMTRKTADFNQLSFQYAFVRNAARDKLAKT